MSQSIIRVIVREVVRAFRSGNFTISAFGKLFVLEHVNGTEYRLTDDRNTDCGIRFKYDHGNVSWFMA